MRTGPVIDRLEAPFSEEQVAALNTYQRSGRSHPFTCAGTRMDDAHAAYKEQHGDPDWGLLVATPEGWLCPVCGYRQTWAHDFMATPTAGDYKETTA
jgi:rubredoxin